MKKTVAKVRLWGTTVGAVSLEEGQKSAQFEYAQSFLSSGIELSPIMMPLRGGVYHFPGLAYESFHGLPGLLADSLPDKFGNELIDLWLAKEGRLTGSFNAVEKLCYTGKRGMGALEYEPALSEDAKKSEKINVAGLVELASMVLSNRSNLREVLDECDRRNLSHTLQKIISLGTSAGGARAKAVIALNPNTNEVRSGQIEAGKGFEYWIIKFSGVNNNKDKEDTADLADYGMIEYVYYLMAVECGIEMMPCKLLDDGQNHHFMTKRFDRTEDGGKLHMQSLGALGHFDYNKAGSTSYEQAFAALNKLNVGHPDKVELFRRMVFNVFACNCDDHVKNISFLMNKKGEWSLAPAYDIAFSHNSVVGSWTSSHQMTINGKRKDFKKTDFDNCAEIAGLKKKEKNDLFEKVSSSVAKWKDFAKQVGVSEDRFVAINKHLIVL